MAKKSHLKFISEKQLSEYKDFKYNYGPPQEQVNTLKNYHWLAVSFRECLAKFDADLETKYSLKDYTLEIPHDIDYIQITFQDQFDINEYFRKYYNDFGLEATAFYDFAKKGLFAIADRDKFKILRTNILNFIEHELEGNQDITYSNYVKYISSFELLRTSDIVKFQLENIGDIVYLSLMYLPLDSNIKQQLVQSLITYLEVSNTNYKYDEERDRLELQKPSAEEIQKIVRNFDIIESVTCSVFITVRPNEFNTVQRKFGFNIENMEEELPIVGIIDTGISQQTALAPLIINDTTFTLAGNPLVDQAGRNNLGHGTAVAGLVALGKHNHKNNFKGNVTADAKLLSIKISDDGNGYISEVDLLKM